MELQSYPKSLQVPALRLIQDGQTIYVTALTAAQITEPGVTKADVWTPENRDGYQRPPMDRRFKGIADYLLGKDALKAIMPQAIILNARKPLSFVTDRNPSEGIAWGKLEIPTSSFPLFEVDGQHRIGGLRRAVNESEDVGEFPVPVVIMDGVRSIDEALTFFVLNTEQKRVPTDIAQRLIARQMDDSERRKSVIDQGKAWIAQGTKIVDIMNGQPGHPWFEKIGTPGVERKVLMKQTSFVDSLKPILDDHDYAERDPREVASALIIYWQAMQDLWPEAFADPKDYVIQKTVGVFPMHRLYPVIVQRTGMRPTKEAVKKVLAGTQIDSSFWAKDGEEAGRYAGAKGFKILKGIIQRRLEDGPPPLIISEMQ